MPAIRVSCLSPCAVGTALITYVQIAGSVSVHTPRVFGSARARLAVSGPEYCIIFCPYKRLIKEVTFSKKVKNGL